MKAPAAVITHTTFKPLDERTAASDNTYASDFSIDLNRAVDTLPEQNAAVVRMRLGLTDEGEITNRETAMRLGLKESAVSRLLARGLQDLRLAMVEYSGQAAA
jgi:RNA polymerase sigma factor (sigma-70 family)